MIRLNGKYKIVIHEVYAKLMSFLVILAGFAGTYYAAMSYYDDLPKKVIIVNNQNVAPKADTVEKEAITPLSPIEKLAKMGVIWNFESIRDAIFNNSNDIVSLFMDGGWKLNPGLLFKLLTDSFYPELITHLSKKNVLWGDDYYSFKCPVPEVRVGNKVGETDILDSEIIDARLDDDGYPRGSHQTPSLPDREPRFYDRIIKYKDANRNRALVVICGDDDVIRRIDRIGDALKAGNIDYGKRKYMYDEMIQKWRDARTVLSGIGPNW